MGVSRYIDSAIDDPLFLRVVMGVWAIPFLAISILFFDTLFLKEGCFCLSWALLLPIGMGAIGALLMGTAFAASDTTVRRRTYLLDDNDFLGIVLIILVGIVAIPICGNTVPAVTP